MKKMIGIVPKGLLFDSEKSNMSDVYELGNNYAKRVLEAGAVPVGLFPVDGRISEEMLELCDGFVVQGGKKMWPYHYQIIHYAVTHGKRYLGICLGMQLIHKYFCLRKMAEEQGLDGDIIERILDLCYVQNKGSGLLYQVEGHRAQSMPRGNEDLAKHAVDIVPGTVLHRLMGKERIRAATFHNWRVEAPAEVLTVNAWATDDSGTVEGVEYGGNILGVQFHPEVDDMLPELFAFLTE